MKYEAIEVYRLSRLHCWKVLVSILHILFSLSHATHSTYLALLSRYLHLLTWLQNAPFFSSN